MSVESTGEDVLKTVPLAVILDPPLDVTVAPSVAEVAVMFETVGEFSVGVPEDVEAFAVGAIVVK